MSAVATEPLLLYSARVCPWAQRATLALEETGLPHSIYEIDLQNKPSWYNDKINPASKVPVLQIGGQDENAEGVPRIPESAVLLELISDLAAERGCRSLTPEDPIERAEARYFIERFLQVVNSVFSGISFRGETDKIPDLYKGIDEIESLLQSRVEKAGGPFWHGEEPGLADIGVAPFVGRLKVFSSRMKALAQTDLHKTVFDKDGKYPIFAQYADALTSRASWNKTFDAEYVTDYTVKRIEQLKAGK